MSCDHDLDAEYLHPGDADILEFYEADGGLRATLALPCPDCSEALELDLGVDTVEEGDFELPLSDELYD
ncbi:hypothetical protein HWV23_00555 [Natronomonas halophila]|uniref:hypothetical protein n=1 Tax=Natronomonas halophila TaxID=2747817 RepID=UPI0015B619FA|nr:hypothetical protein [Natronomonas halophila]QLD84257.1 hypothetical protein HWV23_00555 [Natronomonas halophila]